MMLSTLKCMNIQKYKYKSKEKKDLEAYRQIGLYASLIIINSNFISP